MLLDYLKNVMPFEDAKAQLAKMSPQQKQIELGQRAISRYGCFSCHDIKGFEKAQSIGTDLSEEGSKLVTRLDFAFITDIPHTSKLGVVPDASCTIRASSTRAACCSRSRSCGCRTSTSATTRSSGC